jgi:hypothetical protein
MCSTTPASGQSRDLLFNVSHQLEPNPEFTDRTSMAVGLVLKKGQ